MGSVTDRHTDRHTDAPAAAPGTDTICAIATPPGTGGVGIVRLSGPLAAEMGRRVCGDLPPARRARLMQFHDAEGAIIDHGLVLYFPAPGSFTGEEVLELHGHGGPVVMHMLLDRVLELGARLARPGEFSERAFLNNKLDLAQAEAIADLIGSATESAARAAQQSLSGVFSRRVNALQETLTQLRVLVEAAIDFPDEEIDFLTDSDVVQRLHQACAAVDSLLQAARQGRLLRDGITLAIIGRPNAGKSSLLNALAGQESAIVTAIPGTTRDVLREFIALDGIPVHVADTAGIRDTVDPIELEGVRRARSALRAADLVLLVLDPGEDLAMQQAIMTELPEPKRAIAIWNKRDIYAQIPDGIDGAAFAATIAISAKTGDGVDRLKTLIRKTVGADEQAQGGFSARQRHVDALKRVLAHLQAGHQRCIEDQATELLAEELRLAQRALGEITGEQLPEELLDAIFASFCIGK